ncbi:MAG: hypothetical protein IK085_06695 [Clostridia bacterium]|nr:hypothetical protein [Clostridia bacterium]
MKKVVCIFIAFILCMTLASCGAGKKTETSDGTNSTDASTAVEIAEIEKEIAEKNAELAKKSDEKKKDGDSTPAADRNEWIKAYRNILLNLDKEDIELTDQKPKFCLCLIDSDDIPELVVSTGDFHAASCYLFTFSNGKAVNLGPFGTFGTIQFVEKSGIIIDSLGNNGYLNETYYKLENGMIDSLLDFEIETRDSEKYMIDGSEITKAQYDSLVAKATGGTKPISSPEYENCFEISEESINKNLK